MSIAQRILLRGGRVLALATLSLSQLQGAASAAILYESGMLGPTGVTWEEVTAQTVNGARISSVTFNGVRFQLSDPVITSRIGGHLVGPANSDGSFFGAIVRLENENDFPDSGDLTTPDVLGVASLQFPAPSAEVFGELKLSLNAGWYALVFGSGQFDTAGEGAMPLNNSDIGAPSYIGHQPGAGWGYLINPIFRNYRFVVEGQVVPEPPSFALLMWLFMAVGRARAAHR